MVAVRLRAACCVLRLSSNVRKLIDYACVFKAQWFARWDTRPSLHSVFAALRPWVMMRNARSALDVRLWSLLHHEPEWLIQHAAAWSSICFVQWKLHDTIRQQRLYANYKARASLILLRMGSSSSMYIVFGVSGIEPSTFTCIQVLHACKFALVRAASRILANWRSSELDEGTVVHVDLKSRVVLRAPN